jgi:hypothetical protein
LSTSTLGSTSTLVTQKYVDTYCICLSNYITPNTSTYPESPEAVLCIFNTYQLLVGWGMHRQDTRVGTKKEQSLLKLKETTRGRQE